MKGVCGDIVDRLSSFTSAIIARGVVNAALQHHNLTEASVTARDVGKLVERVARGARLYLSADEQTKLLDSLENLSGGGSGPRLDPRTLDIKDERDLTGARIAMREMAMKLGGTGMSVQKAVTLVSELARNIVSYTNGGTVVLEPHPSPNARIIVTATDSGPGIDNLDEILAGEYRSRTGLGRGILGSKRLSNRFDIQTSDKGNRVEAEVSM